MSEPKNEWMTPGAIIGCIGLVTAAGATYSQYNGRMSVAEAQGQQLEKRLQRMEDKVDYLVGQVAALGGKK